MKPTQQLHDLGQSIWLDNITRDLLDSGTLERYIRELSVTGLTSNPTIFDHAIKNSTSYDAEIRVRIAKGAPAETLFFELALEDLKCAAALFRHLHDQTNGVDGWVSLEVSPLLAHDSVNIRCEPPKNCSSVRACGTCSSKFPGPKKASLRLKRPFTKVYPST
jgi:transaldolase